MEIEIEIEMQIEVGIGIGTQWVSQGGVAGGVAGFGVGVGRGDDVDQDEHEHKHGGEKVGGGVWMARYGADEQDAAACIDAEIEIEAEKGCTAQDVVEW